MRPSSGGNWPRSASEDVRFAEPKSVPFVALATIYVFFDMRVWDELADEVTSDRLPAEIELSL